MTTLGVVVSRVGASTEVEFPAAGQTGANQVFDLSAKIVTHGTEEFHRMADWWVKGYAGVVRVEEGKIVADPAKMTLGLGYPVVHEGRHWWVVNVDGDLIRFYRGPKV